MVTSQTDTGVLNEFLDTFGGIIPQLEVQQARVQNVTRTGSKIILHTFGFLGFRGVVLAHVTSPLHPLPAAEHVVVLVCGDLLRILILREDSCQEEVKHQETCSGFLTEVYRDHVTIVSYLHSGRAVCLTG